MSRCRPLSRRDLFRLSAAGIASSSMSGWIERLAADTADHPQRRRSCILLWMSGGPSQLDTFDLKPGHANAGPFKEIESAVPGFRLSEHLPGIAGFAKDMALFRSLTSKEGDHGRASYFLRTGYLPQGPIRYPSIGALVSKELGADQAELPNFVSIAPETFFNPDAYGSGFLGPQHAPLVIGDRGFQGLVRGQNNDATLKVDDLAPPRQITPEQAQARIDLLKDMEKDFQARNPGSAPQSHRA